MACGCNKGRQQFEVVVGGRVVYTAPSKPAADAVAKRYQGAEVREKGKPQAQQPSQAQGTES
jgi:hypothetical protein